MWRSLIEIVRVLTTFISFALRAWWEIYYYIFCISSYVILFAFHLTSYFMFISGVSNKLNPIIDKFDWQAETCMSETPQLKCLVIPIVSQRTLDIPRHCYARCITDVKSNFVWYYFTMTYFFWWWSYSKTHPLSLENSHLW